MASLFNSVRNLIHDTAQGLVDAQVTTKVSDMYSSFISSGLGVANDTLKIVAEVTAATPPASPPAPGAMSARQDRRNAMYTGNWNDCCAPAPAQGHHGGHHGGGGGGYAAMLLAREIDADTTATSKDGMVGGERPVFLSLEYIVDAGAASPTVKVTTAAGSSSATWTDDAPAEGYTVRQAVLSAAPGTKVTLDVNNAIARLRWCELVCC